MTQEEKQLLLKDLCARLPYGVIINCIDPNFSGSTDEKLYSINWLEQTVISGEWTNEYNIDNIKPYLRPMESMTDEDMEDYARYEFKEDHIWEIVGFRRTGKGFININCINKINGTSQWIFQVNRKRPLENYKGIDWLNKKMFDYRGLIPMGLALPAPKEMYKF
mgnify:CR=1 FL=1